MELIKASSFFNNPFLILFPIIILFLIIISSISLLFIIFISILKRKYFHCKCDICHSYVTSSWSKKFPNLCDWYTNLLQNSPTKTIHIHVLNNIITSNPTNVEYMLKTNFDNYPKGKPFSSILGDLLGNGIFNVDGDSWRFQRKMASLELDRHSVRSFSYHVVAKEIHEHLLPSLSNKAKLGVTIDLQEVLREFSFTTICQFSFGVDMRQLQHVITLEEFAASFDLATNLSAMRALEIFPLAWKVKRFFGIGMEKRLKEAIQKVDGLAMAIIRVRRQMGPLGFTRKDLLSRFMDSVDKDHDRYLRDIIVSFLLAGRDTVASALTSFFWLVAHHPHVESAILNEADRVLGAGLGFSKFDEQVRELQYLEGAIYESMRLYPPVQFDSKFTLNEDVLPDGTPVHKGFRVTYHPYAMGRMKGLWGEDCLEFKPERWLNNKDGRFCQENLFKYPVFHAGVRVCLGKEMALMEIKCVIISLLRKFHIKLATCDVQSSGVQVPQFSPGLTATFKGGLPVVLVQRTSQINSINFEN